MLLTDSVDAVEMVCEIIVHQSSFQFYLYPPETVNTKNGM